jgi:hypothetical protein
MLALDFPQEILERLTERQARAILSASSEQRKMILYEIIKTEEIPSAREIMRTITIEVEDDYAQKGGIIFEMSKPWHYNVQKYVPQNVIESISNSPIQGTKPYKLKVLKYTIESAWNHIEKNGLTKKVLEEAENPLICKICKNRFFDTKVFKEHKCALMGTRDTSPTVSR